MFKPPNVLVSNVEVIGYKDMVSDFNSARMSLFSIDLCHAFENLVLAHCTYQKWKEKVKISYYRKLGDLILKTMALARFLKTECLTKNVREFYIGRALMPVQPRYHANARTFPF